MPITTLTSKGQVTIPKVIRDELGIDTGDKIDFQLQGNHVVITVPHLHNKKSKETMLTTSQRLSTWFTDIPPAQTSADELVMPTRENSDPIDLA